MEHEAAMLTTIDNPYNPFTQYDEWWAYDRYLGHYTPEYLARVAVVPDSLSPLDQELAIDDAIAEIVALNFNGLYARVTKSNFDKVIKQRKEESSA